jgi:hypothetical protein
MVDDATGVENDGVADLTMGAYQRPAATTMLRPRLTFRARLADAWIALINSNPLAPADPRKPGVPLVTDAHDGAIDTERRPDVQKLVGVTEHGNAVDPTTGVIAVGVYEPDRLVFAALHEDVEHDTPVSAAAYN